MDYIISDVQGCFDTLQALLKKINFNEDRDRLYFLGDVVNRGNKSLETLRFIYSLKDNANMVLGNHDFHLLVCALTSRKPNKRDTFSDVLNSRDKSSLLDYLLTKPLFIKYKDAFLVHAGIPPQWSEFDVIENSEFVHQNLRGNNPGEFLSKMYKNEPKLFKDELTNEEKCRYTINALMRMRFCKQNGELEFNHKLNTNMNPAGFKAWFLHSNRALKDKEIFFGHWSNLKNIEVKNIFALDYGCVWGEYLMAYNLSNKTFISQKSIEKA
jgi:bis(5'-nucleosyl)-tetraphosphatase (symmetrical)